MTTDPQTARDNLIGYCLVATPNEVTFERAERLADAYRDAVLAVLPAPVDRAAVPVKQRADCTATEWAEQERARFERLYTRETVRADTAARDAEIYRERLERLGEGYTEQRKRAERAEAEAERLRTYRSAVCICEHTEAQHFEDACLVCDCGDYLPPAAARDVIARWREAAGKAERIRENADFHLGREMGRRQLAEKETACLSADRAAVLREAAQHLYTALFPAVYADMGQKAAEGVNRAVSELRRMADEEQDDEGLSGPCDCGEGAVHYTAADCPAEARRVADEEQQPETPFAPPAAEGLPPAVLDSATEGANRLDAMARTPRGRNFLAHALVQLARDGWLRREAGRGFEPGCICTEDAWPPHCPCRADEQPAVVPQPGKEA